MISTYRTGFDFQTSYIDRSINLDTFVIQRFQTAVGFCVFIRASNSAANNQLCCLTTKQFKNKVEFIFRYKLRKKEKTKKFKKKKNNCENPNNKKNHKLNQNNWKIIISSTKLNDILYILSV